MAPHRDDAAFLDAVDRHRGILLKVASAYCRDASSREDLLQEMVAQLWRAYTKYDSNRSLSTWIYRIAVNVAISFFRTQQRHTARLERVDAQTMDELPAPADPAGDERRDALYEAIRSLDELNRALVLLYLDDRPYAEIADILGISQTNVATKIGRIKQQLKRRTAGA